MLQISACIITLNEEHRLTSCLEALTFASEIIVVDSFSRDSTARIARSYGARLYKRQFTDFVDQKNFAIAKARGSWILSIDADEIVPEALALELSEIASSKSQHSLAQAYRLPRLTQYLGKWIRHGGWYPDYNIRFFKKGAGRFAGGTVHEQFAFNNVSGVTGTAINPLLHFSYTSISSHVERINAYSDAIARDKKARGERSSILWAILKSISKFFLTYFYRLGFLDGRPGLVVAVMAAYYNFLKYSKLWELNQKVKQYRRSAPASPRN